MPFPFFLPIIITATTVIAQQIIKKSIEGDSDQTKPESEGTDQGSGKKMQ
ncbi:hypothetical protein [Desulfonatronovibrio magnus]|nr:hypothetical protein [Desulfonatronovibrio magnus]